VKLDHTSEDKHRWKVVRLDDCTDVPGEIVSADDQIGECCMEVGGEAKTLSFRLRDQDRRARQEIRV
jgi:hypothetical protein